MTIPLSPTSTLPSDHESQYESQKTPFELAWDEYQLTLNASKKKKRRFIQKCTEWAMAHSEDPATAINDAIAEAESKSSEKTSRKMLRKYLFPVVTALKELTGIVDLLTNTNPIAGVVWGCLKVAIQSLDKFASLFETIKSELQALSTHLQNITDYEDLYSKDKKMQKLLCQAYIHVICFWHRIDKECNNYAAALIKAPFSTKKLNTIVTDMHQDALMIRTRADIISAQDSREERMASEAARVEAAEDRRKAMKDRLAQEEFRKENKEEQDYRRFENFCNLLSAKFSNQPNFSRHEKNTDNLISGTCQWLHSNPDFLNWSHRSSSSPTSPILWIYGLPGSGKSTLCSSAINFLSQSPSNGQGATIALAYHFCDFAQPYTATQILSMIAFQLLDKYRDGLQPIPSSLWKLIRSPSPLFEKTETVRDLITLLIEDSAQVEEAKVFIFLDGLDEEIPSGRWHDTVKVVRFLINLAQKHPDTVRLWCSSQPREEARNELSGCLQLDITSYAKEDIAFYLSEAVSKVQGPQPSDQEEILAKLQGRAECSFLWAKLMMDDLERRSISLSSMQELVEEGFPKNLVDYYSRIFERFEEPLRPLACKVFSLLVFAQRALRLSELWEAIWCLESKSKEELRGNDKPFRKSMDAIFQPFIELTKISSEESTGNEDFTCRLFHSTLRDFLLKHPFALCNSSPPSAELRICPQAPVNACLFYLGLSRYSNLLVRSDGKWVDNNGDPVDSHRFLVYASKFWDKHLDDIVDPRMRQDLLEPFMSFITSSNFRTCVQIQSLWVESQFSVFFTKSESGAQYLRRVFPSWFARETEPGKRLWKDYRNFLHEWKYFLNCGNCGIAPDCEILPYKGQLNRIWFGALGPNNFLSQLRGQCTTFAFQTSEHSDIRVGYFFDRVVEGGNELMILRVQAPHSGKCDEDEPSSSSNLKETVLKCVCETWGMSGEPSPNLLKTQSICVSTTSCNWYSYVGGALDDPSQKGRASPAAFASDGRTLRIGIKLFKRGASGEFVAVPELDELYDRGPKYIEEFARRGHYVVVATRSKPPKARSDDDGSGDEDDLAGNESDESDDDSFKSDLDSEDDESEPENSGDGYESESDGSTVYSADSEFEDDKITPWRTPMGLDDDSEGSEDERHRVYRFHDSDAESESDDSDDESKHDGVKLNTSESDEEDEDTSEMFNQKQWLDEDEYDFDGLPHFLSGKKSRKHQKSKGEKAQASIAIFDTKSRKPTLLFRQSFSIKCKLYGSPPVFHPTKSLVVWPLADGDVLFVDFSAQTYFTRRLRPSTLFTRHVFMKCHFSECGEFMHLASLEAQAPGSQLPKPSSEDTLFVKLALLISTYRLSSKKTTRSPPTLIHRVRVTLGETDKLSVSNLPFTVTWAPKDLYVSCSGRQLRVYRIPLFGTDQKASEDPDEQPVWRPRKPLFLPESALSREVYYFARTEKDSQAQLPARIIMGCDTRPWKDVQPHETEMQSVALMVDRFVEHVLGRQLSEFYPPIGCYIDEESVLSGWVNSYTRTNILEQNGVGVLDHRMEGVERFNPDNDCDLEPYIY